MGVPVILGGGGVERVVEIPLTSDEKAMLDKSSESVKSIVEVCRRTS
jgi:malate dehydrogenase